MNKNEKAAMLAELKALMRKAHREARKNNCASEAQRIVNAVKHVLAVGLEYSMGRKDVQILLEDLYREALDEVKKEMEEQEHAQ